MADVQSRVQASGLRWQPASVPGPRQALGIAMRGSGEAEASFSFCDGRLVMYAVNLAGGFGTFVRLVERLSAASGPPSFLVTQNETVAGPYPFMRAEWQRPGWRESVTVGEFQGSITASRVWGADGACR